MKRHTPVVASVLALIALAALPCAAFAITGPEVDPNAPCFRWPAVDYDKDGIFDRVDNCTNTPAGCVVDKYGCSLDSDGDGVCDGLDQCEGTPAGVDVDKVTGCSDSQMGMRRSSTPPPAARAAVPVPPPPPPPPPPVSETQRKLMSGRIRLEEVLFESETAKMMPESEDGLNEVGRELEKFPDLILEVQGHTDTRGAASYNMRLSQQRAATVRTYLIDHFRLKPGNITAKGYGETRPETQERNQEELLRNRRVEIEIKNPEVLPRGVEVEKG